MFMKEEIYRLYQQIRNNIGTGKDLCGECELASALAVAALYEQYKEKDIRLVCGRVTEPGPWWQEINKDVETVGHWWCEIDDDIIDLSVEQFGCEFEFPVSNERINSFYTDILEVIAVDEAFYNECLEIKNRELKTS
jgi:hypothetical protein